MGSQCFATNELVGDQGSAAPPASRKSLSQALDEAVSCSEKRRLWLELEPRGPGSMDSVPRRGSSAATCTSTTATLDLPLLSPAISQPAHPRAPRSPRLPDNFSCWTLTGCALQDTNVFVLFKGDFAWRDGLIAPSGGLLTRCCHGVSISVGEDLAGPTSLPSNDNCRLSKMLDYQSVKSVKPILTERKAPSPICRNHHKPIEIYVTLVTYCSWACKHLSFLSHNVMLREQREVYT